MSEELTAYEKQNRSDGGECIVTNYRLRNGDNLSSDEEVMTDVLSELMHFWSRQAREVTFTSLYERAVDHTNVELGFPQEFDSFPGAGE